MKYLKQTYERMAVELDPAEEYFSIDSRFMTLERVLRSIPKGRMCDVGCGRGALLKRLQDHHEVCGCEYNPEAVEYCRSIGLTVEPLDLNSDESLPFTQHFDVIVISEVCEHLLDPRHALKLLKRALRPGGTLLLTVPNAVPLFVRFAVLFGKSCDLLHYPSSDTEKTGHLRFYTVESMGRLLREEGFVPVEIRGVSFRMNGRFWASLCYWSARCLGMDLQAAPAQIDAWFGRMLPGLSPGLLFVCKAS